jgi:hypothetical protein
MRDVHRPSRTDADMMVDPRRSSRRCPVYCGLAPSTSF